MDYLISLRVGHGRDRMAVGFTTTYAISGITTNVVSSNPAHGKVYWNNYVIKFVSDLHQVGIFFWYSSIIGQ